VPGIVLAVRIAAPSWPPMTPPIVRMTVFMPVAIPVSVGRTASTISFAIAANAAGTPAPRTNIPSTMFQGSECHSARIMIPPEAMSIPTASGHFEP